MLLIVSMRLGSRRQRRGSKASSVRSGTRAAAGKRGAKPRTEVEVAPEVHLGLDVNRRIVVEEAVAMYVQQELAVVVVKVEHVGNL